MNLERLLHKLEAEAEEDAWLKRKTAAIQLKSKVPTRAETNTKRIAELRKRTGDMRHELETNRELAEETKLHQEAALALYRSNLTPAQKREQEQDAYRMGVWASGFCAEASPNWREEAQAAFNSKNLPPSQNEMLEKAESLKIEILAVLVLAMYRHKWSGIIRKYS